MTLSLAERAPAYSDKLTRFADILSLLPALPAPPVLDLGCGAARCALAIQRRWMEARVYGLDRTVAGMPKQLVAGLMIQGDLRTLPLRRRQFGLVVIRHPDVDLGPESWQSAVHSVPGLLCEAGLLLVTCYSLAELDQIRGWLPDQREFRLSPERIAPPDRVNHDRFAAAWRICGRDQ